MQPLEEIKKPVPLQSEPSDNAKILNTARLLEVIFLLVDSLSPTATADSAGGGREKKMKKQWLKYGIA